MTSILDVNLAQSLYELSWACAQNGKFALDLGTETLLDVNPELEVLTGYSREELIGMRAIVLHPEAELERIRDEIRSAGKRSWEHSGFHILRKDGRCVPVAISASKPFQISDRSVGICEVRDLSVGEAAERHLAHMEVRYRGLLEAAPDGMVVVNERGEIVLLNARAESQFGYRRDELLGQKVTTIIPEGFAERLIADGTRTAVEALAQQIGTGIELNGRRKDGSEFPIEIMLSPLKSDEGLLVTAAVRDITVQKEREHRLTAQNWALRAYARAALAMAKEHTSNDILQGVCEAITGQSIYVLAWVGIAEAGENKKIQIAAAAGNAVGYLDGLQLSWSENEAWGESPSGVCMRTNTLQFTDDTETSPAFAPWRERAMQYGIRSSVSIPLRIEGGWQGALTVYAAHPNAFEAAAIEVLQHLAEQIVRAVHALDQDRKSVV